MELARRNNIDIPSLCYKKGFEGLAKCRLCMVEVKEGSRTKVVSSCVYPIKEGIEVNTNTEKIVRIRKNIIILLLLRTPNNFYIQTLAREYGVEVPQRYLDKNKTENCILCGLCVKACEKIRTNAISMVDQEGRRTIWNKTFDLIQCAHCGKFFTTLETYYYMNNRLEEDSKKEQPIGKDCKRKMIGEKFREAFENI